MLRDKVIEKLIQWKTMGLSHENFTAAEKWVNQYIRRNETELLKYVVTNIRQNKDGVTIDLATPHDPHIMWRYAILNGKITFVKDIQ